MHSALVLLQPVHMGKGGVQHCAHDVLMRVHFALGS